MVRKKPCTVDAPMEEQRVFLTKVQSDQLQAAFERRWNAARTYDRLPDAPLGMPALICAALSAEIDSKPCYSRLAAIPGEHNLAKLLGLLPQATRYAIVADVSVNYPDFPKQLANAENAFIRWRYFYEAREDLNINILFVGTLGAAIQNQIGLNWVAA